MVCERHADVIESIDIHESRLKFLELADIETKTEIRNLIKQVEKLVCTIEKFMSNAWKVLLLISCGGVGFVIWYIQTL